MPSPAYPHEFYKIEFVVRLADGRAEGKPSTIVINTTPPQWLRGVSNHKDTEHRCVLLSSEPATREERGMYEASVRQKILDQVADHAKDLKW